MNSALRLIRGQNLPFQYGAFPDLSKDDATFLKKWAEKRWTEELNNFWISILLRHSCLTVYVNEDPEEEQ